MTTKKDIAKIASQPNALSVPLPEHLALAKGEKIAGIENTAHLVRPPYLKIVQKQSDDKLIEQFGIGTAVIQPDGVVLGTKDVPFHVVPLYSYFEFAQWAPIEQKGKMPMVLARTLDENSALAKKCRNRDLWKEDIEYNTPDGGVIKCTVRNCEHIVFIMALVGHPAGDHVFSVSFSRGEYRSGLSLNAAIKQRKTHAYNCVFSLTCTGGERRKNEKGSWNGLDVNNPAEGVSPWCTKEQAELFKSLYEEAKDNHRKGLLSVALEDEVDATSSVSSTVVADDGGTDQM